MGCFAKKLTELVFPANKTFTQYHHQRKRLFDDIYGYDNIKRLFRMALDSIHPTFDNTVAVFLLKRVPIIIHYFLPSQ
jgi:hypothetical protein